MGYTASSAVPWPVPPDWTKGVTETLSSLTEVLQAARTGVTQHRRLRQEPRRAYAFEVAADGQDRRVAEQLLTAQGVAEWAMPIWPDVQRLTTARPAGAGGIPCATEWLDFEAGGQALLWRSVNDWELVNVDEVQETGLVLADALQSAWPVGTRLYPVRPAVVEDGAQETLWHDNGGRRPVSVQFTAASAWPAHLPAATYQGFPVLEDRPEESDSPTVSSSRLITIVDEQTAVPERFDLGDIALRLQRHRWLLQGRAQRAAHRSLLYGLAGRGTPLWRPTWTSDLVAVATLGAGAVALSVQWCAYTLAGFPQTNRRDIRIQLRGGMVFYRAITEAVDNGATETLTLDAGLPVAVGPSNIARISYLVFCTLASDDVEIQHATDSEGVATCAVSFMEVPRDV